MVTIKEIANEAGVSATTVSNVLHGKVNKVSPHMIEKIQELLKEHNYIPRFGLNALTSKGSRMIAVLISTPDFAEETPYERPFYGNIIGTLESLLRERGYYMIVFSSKDISEIMRMSLGWNVDGIIAISMAKKYFQKIKEMTEKPVISIDMDVSSEKSAGDMYNVTSPDYEAGKMMMDYLLEKGTKEVIYVANVKRGSDYRRYQGAKSSYSKFFKRQKELKMVFLEHTYEERMKQYDELAKCRGKDAALFFATDLNAAEAIEYFNRTGVKIPEEISVVGTDDNIYARLATPRLTTIRVDSSEKAKMAADILLDIVEGKEVEEYQREIEISFVERESVKLVR
ncbi:LacI family transcriptional regulator [Aequitasia blattaphilus]|uniref:LacI family transcriptional regulator n=1 Tax=Aequitasia blattaphilus TaxID=2949332 RepID=A0ABT1EDH1_9FIRM|nr:LacI family DNA-binding transcriptional regulator [Aequitasia blattaphilus]MCP1103007.1 LacI family transcriptional regulator [Aequitasia blattaphilus]MCR8615647.1 LacI family transcriptional regulator [Aequitasia blattaphilus]